MNYNSSLPTAIKKYIKNSEIKDMSCNSNAKTIYVSNGTFIKIDQSGLLEHECEMTRFFNKYNLGVEVLDYKTIENVDYLITKMGIGKDARNFINEPKKLCYAIAESLNKLHSIKTKTLISPRQKRFMRQIKNPIMNNIDLNYLFPGSNIKNKESIIELLNKKGHLLDSSTLVHGDACLPNILIKNYKFTTFIDLNLAGMGDKHMDIYWALWSLGYNLGTFDYNNYFIDAYGRKNINIDSLSLIEALETF